MAMKQINSFNNVLRGIAIQPTTVDRRSMTHRLSSLHRTRQGNGIVALEDMIALFNRLRPNLVQ
jgi:hypothetical protein